MPAPALTLGVMTDPMLGSWRALLRSQYAKLTEASAARFSVQFVIGELSTGCAPATLKALDCRRAEPAGDLLCGVLLREGTKYRDLAMLRHARDCGGRRGQAVAEKAFEWFAHAAQHSWCRLWLHMLPSLSLTAWTRWWSTRQRHARVRP